MFNCFFLIFLKIILLLTCYQRA